MKLVTGTGIAYQFAFIALTDVALISGGSSKACSSKLRIRVPKPFYFKITIHLDANRGALRDQRTVAAACKLT